MSHARWHRGAALRLLVEDDGDGHTLLTAAGDLSFKAAREKQRAAASIPRLREVLMSK